MTIYDIKRLTAKTEPDFFSRATLKFFGQTLQSFRVYKQPDGKYLITADSSDNWRGHYKTQRLFNPETNKLEMINN